jgi:hypothetical protein
MGSRVVLDPVEYKETSCSYRKSNPGRPTCSPLLCQLSYPGSDVRCTRVNFHNHCRQLNFITALSYYCSFGYFTILYHL